MILTYFVIALTGGLSWVVLGYDNGALVEDIKIKKWYFVLYFILVSLLFINVDKVVVVRLLKCVGLLQVIIGLTISSLIASDVVNAFIHYMKDK